MTQTLPRPLQFAMVSGGAVLQPALERFIRTLAHVLARPVVATLLDSSAALGRSLDRGDTDLAWLPPVPALQLASEERLSFVALPVRNDAASYSSALFTRKDSTYPSIDRLAGARIAWVDPLSAAGYMVPRAKLVAEGLDLSSCFAEQRFVGSHLQVVDDVLDGTADLGATFVHLDKNGEVTHAGWSGKVDTDDLRILLIEGPIPADVLGATDRVPPEALHVLQQAMMDPATELCQAAQALFRADHFERPTTEHFLLITRIRDLLIKGSSSSW